MTPADVPAAFAVRTATKENRFTREGLAALGITEDSVAMMLGGTHRGWVAEVDGRIVGFAMGDRTTAELWVIAVRPEFEGRGIGTRLLAEVEDWLVGLGKRELWLWTSPNRSLRAHRFYCRHEWREAEVKDGQLVMKKSPGTRARPSGPA
jgi:GNAT superfamily N-acetyltransferase